jgi:DNA-binding response OmpR family regulator
VARRERLAHLGAQGYVTKPFTPEVLRGEIERVLGVNPDGALVGTGAENGELADEFSF